MHLKALPDTLADAMNWQRVMFVLSHIAAVGASEYVQHMTHAVCLPNCPNHLQDPDSLLQRVRCHASLIHIWGVDLFALGLDRLSLMSHKVSAQK